MIESDETVQVEWNRLTDAITDLFCAHGRRGLEYVKSRGLRPPKDNWPARLLTEIGAMLRWSDMIASGEMKSLLPEYQHTPRFFELRAEVLLCRLLNTPEAKPETFCTMHWPITCFLLRCELWWSTDKIGKDDLRPHLLSAITLNTHSLDALASLLWAKSANMN